MDEFSRCIGLITSSDILNYEQEHADESAECGTADIYDPESQQWESVPLSAFGLEEFGDVFVSDVMTRDLIWVDRDTPLKDVAQRMIDSASTASSLWTWRLACMEFSRHMILYESPLSHEVRLCPRSPKCDKAKG